MRETKDAIITKEEPVKMMQSMTQANSANFKGKADNSLSYQK